MSETFSILMLRLEAPLVSFGGPAIDKHGVITRFPAQSMLTGLLANALGYTHKESERLQRLQERIRYAVRIDRKGEPIVDYQTVYLGQDFMRSALTMRGEVVQRGGSDPYGTHIRLRHYRADAAYTVALRLDPPDEEPTLDDTEGALRNPARPLFIGRKNCLPSGRIYLGKTEATTLLEALKNISLAEGSDQTDVFEVQWPEEEEKLEDDRIETVYDERDWTNQIHCGERRVRRGFINLKGAGIG